MPYSLGIKPDTLKIFLYRDADFDSVLTRRDDAGVEQPWGTSDIRLVFPAIPSVPSEPASAPLMWTCDVVGAQATFQIDKVVVNERSHGDLVELWVGDQCWAAGKVTKKGMKGLPEPEAEPT